MSELKLPTRKFGQPPSDFIDDDDTTENIVDQFSSDRTDRSDSDKEKKNEESNEIIVVDDEEDESSDDSSDESSDDDGSVSLKSSNESVENLAWNSKVAAPRQEPPIGNRTVNIESDKDKEIDNRLTEERIDDESDSDDETFDEDEMELDSEEEEKAVARQYRSAYMNNYDFECFDLYYSSSDDEMEIDKTPTSSVEDCNALEEVPDAWSDSNEICGANALEEEEQQACEFFKQTQKNLKRWNNEPKNEKLANTYFDSVHDLLQLRPFKRLRRNPYLIEKESNVRLFDFSPLQSAYFTTHKQLAHLVHNSVPHHLQILVLHPKNKDLWYRVGRLAAEIGDWKNAEFAYRQLICVSKEKNKGLQAIALVHFISGDFLKCLDDIKELLNYNPTNIIASALISELSRLNGPWSKYVEEVLILHGFKRNSRDSQQMKQVLKRIEAFRERLKDQCSKCRKQLKSSSQHAIKMVLTAEDLLFSHFTKRLIGFHDQVKKNTDAFLVFKYPVDGNSVNKKAEKVNSPTVLQTAPAASEPPALPEITELAYLHKKGRMECNENLSVEEEIENIMKNLMNQIDINVNTELTEEPPMKKQRVNVQCQPDVYVRRSTRFVEETNDDPSNTSQQQTWDVKDCLRVDRNTDFVFPSPLQSQSDVNYLLPNNPSIDKLDENVEIPEFLNMLLNKNKCERGLNGYAGVVAKLLDYVQKQVQCHGYGLEVVDKIAFLALYHKLTDMSNIVEIQPTMNVEFFAAEIGSELALKKLNEYARSLTHQHLTNVDEFEQSVEPQGTVPVESSSDWIEKVEASNDSMMKSLVRMRQELRKSRPPKSTECKKSKYRMINYVSGLTDNLLLQATLQNLGHKKPLDLCVDEGTLILCQPDFLPYGLIAPDVQLLSSEERRFLCRYHWFRALKFRNSKTDEVQSAYLALEWKHLLIMMKILNYHNLMGCTEDLGVTREELEWTSERLVYLTHEIKGRNAFCMLITMKKENIQSVIDYFVKEHDYMTDTVESTLTYLAAVYRCYLSENDYEGMFSTILRMSKILLDHSMKSTSIIKQAFSFCLTQLDAHLNEFSSLSAFTIRKIAKLLSLFTDKSFYRTFASLWILCYRLTVIESKEPVAEFKEHFNQAKKVVNFLPTRGLMILQEGHEALAEKNCCMNDQGEFVRFYLRELNRVITLSAFEEALIDFGSGIAAVLEHNVECEIIQAVACLCSLSINSKKHHIESHTIGDPKPMEWSILKLILPFLVPKKIPLFDDNQVLRMELIDLIRQSTDLIMIPINDELKNRFDQFVRDHCSYNLKFTIDTNGHMGDADPIHCGQNMFDWPSVAKNELADFQRKLSAIAMYLMAFHLYRQTQKEAVEFAQTALMFGRNSLSDELLSSTWMMIAKTKSCIVLYDDRKLFAHMDEMFFPFRMSLLFNKKVAEAHLDIGILLYQCHARIRRFIRIHSSDQLVPNLKKQAGSLLSSCQLHFLLAELYKTQTTDTAWLVQYFLGKVSEKLDQPIETVLEYYFECAKRLRAAKYFFLKRVSRKKQINFEPLELVYRVHKYLNVKRNIALRQNDLKTMRTIISALKLWSTYAICKNSCSDAPPFFEANLFQYLTLSTIYSPIEETLAIPVVMEEMLEMVDLNEKADQMIVSAYNAILGRFPHYKAAYQVMQVFVSEKKYEKAVDFMFKEIFPLPKKTSPFTSIFEQFTEIQRADFERCRSLDYHIARIIKPLAELLEKTRDLERLIFVTYSLSAGKKRDDELISDECASRLILMCVKRLVRLMSDFKLGNVSKFWKQLPLLVDVNQNLKDRQLQNKDVDKFHAMIMKAQSQVIKGIGPTPVSRPAIQPVSLSPKLRLSTASVRQPNAQVTSPNAKATQFRNRIQQLAAQAGAQELLTRIQAQVGSGVLTQEQLFALFKPK